VVERSTIETVDVRADGTGLFARAGAALLALGAQRLGLTDGLSAALGGTRGRRSGHRTCGLPSPTRFATVARTPSYQDRTCDRQH